MTHEWKRCPFCGCQPREEGMVTNFPHTWFCFMRAEYRTNNKATWSAWNTRYHKKEMLIMPATPEQKEK